MSAENDLLFDRQNLTQAQMEIVERLEAYDMSFVFEKLALDRKLDAKDSRLLEREFKRYIALAGFGIYPLAMIGPFIDEVWHQFILFTKQYREFCFKTVGFFVGHQPDIPSMPVPLVAGENFRSQYNRHFGPLPDIWFEGMSNETRAYYQAPALIGKPPSAWSGWAGPEF